VAASPELRRVLGHLRSAHRLVGVGSWLGVVGDELRMHWSPEAREIAGWTEDRSPTFADVVAMVHPDDRPLLLEMRASALAGERPFAIDLRLIRPDGEQRRVHLAAEIERDEDGTPTRLVGALQDRTEVLDSLRQLRVTEVSRRDLLERLLATAGTERARLARHLASGPIERLVEIEQLLQEAMPDVPVQVWHDALASVRKAVESLHRTLTDIQAEPSTADLAEALEEMAAESVPELDIALDVTVDAPLQPPVRASLLRVVHEALHNVRKHAAASRVEVQCRLADGRVHVSVSDDGRGFDVDATRNLSGHLGIVAMRERLEAVGGELEIRSCPGRTTVEAWLPVA
jgi:signal transduction histidine kinase